MHPNTGCILSHLCNAFLLRPLPAQLCTPSPYSPFETHSNHSLLLDPLNHPGQQSSPLCVPSNWFMPPGERAIFCPPCRLLDSIFSVPSVLCLSQTRCIKWMNTCKWHGSSVELGAETELNFPNVFSTLQSHVFCVTLSLGVWGGGVFISFHRWRNWTFKRKRGPSRTP